jgi:hypothetical protein
MVGANVIDPVDAHPSHVAKTGTVRTVRDRERQTPRIVTAMITTIPKSSRTVERFAKIDFCFIPYLLVSW